MHPLTASRLAVPCRLKQNRKRVAGTCRVWLARPSWSLLVAFSRYHSSHPSWKKIPISPTLLSLFQSTYERLTVLIFPFIFRYAITAGALTSFSLGRVRRKSFKRMFFASCSDKGLSGTKVIEVNFFFALKPRYTVFHPLKSSAFHDSSAPALVAPGKTFVSSEGRFP